MRVIRELTVSIFCILVGASSIVHAEQVSFRISEQKLREAKIERDLGKAVVSWLSGGNELAGDECDTLVDSLLGGEGPTLRAYFIAAQVASLRGRYQDAISALEIAIEKYPDDEAPIRLHISTGICARLWIANITRQSGDKARAQEAYEELLSMLGGTQTSEGIDNRSNLIMTCHLYLAETERELGQGNQKALSHLEAVEMSDKKDGVRGAGIGLRKSWAHYESTKLTKGRAVADSQLLPAANPASAYALAVHHLLLTGISGEPLVGSRKGMNIVMDTLIDRTVQRKVSRVDADLARLAYGYDQDRKGKPERAEKYLSSLFKDDSFFSPLAGISLARVKEAQSKADEAQEVLDQVQSKYPGYGPVVTQLRHSPK